MCARACVHVCSSVCVCVRVHCRGRGWGCWLGGGDIGSFVSILCSVRFGFPDLSDSNFVLTKEKLISCILEQLSKW